MSASATQLPLRLNPQQEFNFNNFYFQQAELKQALLDLCLSESVGFLYLWGATSSGKSHLLLAALEQTELRSVYLPLADLVQTASPEVLNSLEQFDLVCIDDLDAIASLTEWQEALFHCFNRLQHSACKLLVSASSNPVNIPLSLADLRSRMSTALVYQLDALDDEQKQQALTLQAASRGLDLSDELVHYLLRHYSRDMGELIELLLKLDKASLAEKRRLTIPFVRQTIESLA